VGKLSKRRNIPLLVEAFATLVHEDRIPHTLLLFGPNHLGLPIARQAASLGVGDRVIQNDGRIGDHRDLVSVYTGADLFVSASSYEGTSLPLLEAMSCGTPVVAMRRGALPELAGDAALFASEVTAPALSEAMRRALNDSELVRQLRARGLVRVEAYRWHAVARRSLEVVREAARS
jgi:glycosyltransferase involved in cell wall biosynthesis